MLRLYRVLGDNRILMTVIARALDVNRATVWRWVKEESEVKPRMREIVEAKLRGAGIYVAHPPPGEACSLWDSEPDFVHPFFAAEAPSVGGTHRTGVELLVGFNVAHPPPGVDPNRKEEAAMAQKIGEAVLAKFRLERDPFLNELHSAADIFMSKAHRAVEWQLLDAAEHQYFMALVGAVGSGKTVVVKRVLEKLGRDGSGYKIARLRCVEKEEATAYGIMEALVRSFSSDAPKRSRESRALQLGKMLEQMLAEKVRPVLVIDEAHALNYRTLRALKRLYDETEVGFRRSIAILLVGQNSNHDKSYNLEEKLGNWDLREVSERCQVVKLGGLKGELGDYLAWKFSKAGSRREIVTPDGVRFLASALRRGKDDPTDRDVPLVVNNIVACAMNLAFDVGKDTINAELMSEAIKQAQSH